MAEKEDDSLRKRPGSGVKALQRLVLRLNKYLCVTAERTLGSFPTLHPTPPHPHVCPRTREYMSSDKLLPASDSTQDADSSLRANPVLASDCLRTVLTHMAGKQGLHNVLQKTPTQLSQTGVPTALG